MNKYTTAPLLNVLFWVVLAGNNQLYGQTAEASVYAVYELVFQGENYQASDAPAAEVAFTTTWRHESGSPTYTVHGFYVGFPHH